MMLTLSYYLQIFKLKLIEVQENFANISYNQGI